MKGSEKAIFGGVGLLVLALAFYMLILSPKRAEVKELDDELTSLESSISQQEQLIAFGQEARKQFPKDYANLVVLGKAVPDQSDTASLMVQLNSIAGSSGTDFRGIALNTGGSGDTGTAATATTTTAPATPTGTAATDSASASGTAATATATPAPAPATEAAAANLPIGAVVGTAGLPTLPYDLTFTGGFFGIADYIKGVDDLVRISDKNGNVEVNGRLMTIDGFSLKGGSPGSDPILDANFMLTSYVTPSTQGLTAGASPTGPSPAGVAPVTPASSTSVTP